MHSLLRTIEAKNPTPSWVVKHVKIRLVLNNIQLLDDLFSYATCNSC